MTDTVESVMALAEEWADAEATYDRYAGRADPDAKEAALRAAVERVIAERDDAIFQWQCDQERAERAEAEPPLYTISRGSDGRATVTTTPAPDDARERFKRWYANFWGLSVEVTDFDHEAANVAWKAWQAAMKDQP